MKGTENLKARSKMWLEIDGSLAFGDGKASLLKAIHDTGSISGAAKRLGMSYRRAWSYIDAIEKRLGVKLVRKEIGGKGGGYSQLTKDGEDLLESYINFRSGINEFVDGKFREYFNV